MGKDMSSVAQNRAVDGGSRSVYVGHGFVRYCERESCFKLYWEPTAHGRPILYVPSPHLWPSKVPDWASGRREEILQTIQRETPQMNFVWQEVDEA